jgi:hypothetical protein
MDKALLPLAIRTMSNDQVEQLSIASSSVDRGVVKSVFMAIDGLRSGMFLVDGYGFLVHGNIAGRTMLAAGEVLYQDADRLAARDAEADRTLQSLFAAVAIGNVSGTSSVLLVGSSAPPHVAHVFSLLTGKRRKARSPSAALPGTSKMSREQARMARGGFSSCSQSRSGSALTRHGNSETSTAHKIAACLQPCRICVRAPVMSIV